MSGSLLLEISLSFAVRVHDRFLHSFLPVRPGIPALDIILQAVHQLSPGGIAGRAEIADLFPTALREAQGGAPVLRTQFPCEDCAVPFRMIAVTTPNHALGCFELLYLHAKDHAASFEAEFSLSADPLVRRGIGRPPTAQRYECGYRSVRLGSD